MRRGVMAALLVTVFLGSLSAVGPVRLEDESDRAAFRSWFVFLADAQFYRTTPDVSDCAALVRHAFREALKTHSPRWLRGANLPFAPAIPDVRRPPRPDGNGWPLFLVDDTHRAEFADAATIVRLNAHFVSRDPAAARPGDLLFFRQSDERRLDHLMVFVGRSLFERAGDDWIVYHTGPEVLPGGRVSSRAASGEVRKVSLADLTRHPSPRWRPLPDNHAFAGVFRLAILW